LRTKCQAMILQGAKVADHGQSLVEYVKSARPLMAKLCKHIYQILGTNICEFCTKPTHETDWSLIAKQRQSWIKEGKQVQQGWWSI